MVGKIILIIQFIGAVIEFQCCAHILGKNKKWF